MKLLNGRPLLRPALAVRSLEVHAMHLGAITVGDAACAV